MKNALSCGIFSVCLFAFTAGPLQAAEPKEPKAVIISVDGKGTAKVRRKSGTESVAGAAQEIAPGDKITTDAASVVQMRLIDGTIVRIGFNTEYRLEDNKVKNGVMAWVFELTRGTIRAMVEKGPRTKESKFRVNTPAGTMGVRGTELMFEHNQDKRVSSLYVLEGKVGFGARDCEAKRDCVEVVGGQRASIQEGSRKVDGPHGFNVQELAKQTAAEAREAMKANGGASGGSGMSLPAELAARLSVFASLGKLGREAVLLDDEELMKMARNSGQQLMDLQDNFLDRDASTRKLMEESAAAGTYGDRLKVGEAAGVSSDPDHISGMENVKKFKKSEEAAMEADKASGKKAKNAASAKAAADAKKLQEREANFKRAKNASSSKNHLGDLAEKIDQAKKNIAAAKKRAEVNQISLDGIGDLPDTDSPGTPSVSASVTATDTDTASDTRTDPATDLSITTGGGGSQTNTHTNTDTQTGTQTQTQTDTGTGTATQTDTQSQQEVEQYRTETLSYSKDVCLNWVILWCDKWARRTTTETHQVDARGKRTVTDKKCTETKEVCRSEYKGCPGIAVGRGCPKGSATKKVCSWVTTEISCGR